MKNKLLDSVTVSGGAIGITFRNTTVSDLSVLRRIRGQKRQKIGKVTR